MEANGRLIAGGCRTNYRSVAEVYRELLLGEIINWDYCDSDGERFREEAEEGSHRADRETEITKVCSLGSLSS